MHRGRILKPFLRGACLAHEGLSLRRVADLRGRHCMRDANCGMRALSSELADACDVRDAR